jgi:nitroreductase
MLAGDPARGSNRETADAFADLLAQRWSCRAFQSREVNRPTIERILALAQRTASWCNAQPWQVIVTSGTGTARFREAMSGHAMAGEPPRPDFPFPREYPGVYRDRRRACGLQLYDSVGIAHGDRQASTRQALENFRFFGAPHVAIVTTPDALGIYGTIDCGAYVSNFALAAQSLGVASIAQAALASYPDVVRRHFGLAEERRVVCGISFGYADGEHPINRFRTDRAAPEDVVTWVEE